MNAAFVLYVVFSLVVGFIAQTRGRNFLGWSALALIFSPLIAGILAFCMGDPRAEQARRIEELNQITQMRRSRGLSAYDDTEAV